MKSVNALRRFSHNADRLVSIDDRLASIDEGIVNMSRDLNKRLDKLIELQQAEPVMQRDVVEAIDRLTAAVQIRR
jgi:hypothetical protein